MAKLVKKMVIFIVIISIVLVSTITTIIFLKKHKKNNNNFIIEPHDIGSEVMYKKTKYLVKDLSPESIIRGANEEGNYIPLLIKSGKIISFNNVGENNVFTSIEEYNKLKKLNDSITVVFLNDTTIMQTGFGTPNLLDVRDPLTQIAIKIGFSGEFEYRVCENKSEEFYRNFAAKSNEFDNDTISQRLSSEFISNMNPIFTKTIFNNKLSYIEIYHYIFEISQIIHRDLKESFEKKYGLELVSVTLDTINISENDKMRIEEQMKQIKFKVEKRKDVKEIIEDLGALKDKEWERIIYIDKLKREDKEKYIETVKFIKEHELNALASIFSNNEQVTHVHVNGLNKCPTCGNTIDGKNAFCPFCGNKIY